MVTDPGYGEDSFGCFDIGEITLFNSLKNKVRKVRYGDYGAIHPVKVEVPGSKWIPRIDFPKKRSIYYHRVRRDKDESSKKAYVTAAKRIIRDSSYVDFANRDVWGLDEIIKAANGEPTGISPSFWISVRFNLHVTRQYLRLL
jgi:hypothetical protein